MDTLDITLRLGAATLVGIVLGLNRDLHGKSTGVRTLGVLCLGSALAVLSIHAVTGSDASRVIQGIVTGVGFLGAGVIVRSEKGHHVQGLTTAAVVWVTACLGAACAVARWQIVVIGVVLVFVILVFGGPFEKAIDRRWPWRPMEVADRPPDTTGGNERDPSDQLVDSRREAYAPPVGRVPHRSVALLAGCLSPKRLARVVSSPLTAEEGSRSVFAPELFDGMVTPSGVRKAFNKLAA